MASPKASHQRGRRAGGQSGDLSHRPFFGDGGRVRQPLNQQSSRDDVPGGRQAWTQSRIKRPSVIAAVRESLATGEFFPVAVPGTFA